MADVALTRANRPTTPPGAATRPGARAFGIAVLATFAIYLLPGGDLLGRPLVWLATMIHELGHGVTALLIGGGFDRFEMSSNGSGFAITGGYAGGTVASALVSAGGLIGPSIAGAIGFVLARGQRTARLGLLAIAVVLLWAVLFKTGNVLAGVTMGTTLAICGGVALLGSPRAVQLLLMFLSVQLAASLWRDVGYMFSTDGGVVAGRSLPSDSAAIGQALGGPFWLWGGLCAAISLVVLAVGAKLMMRRR